MERYEINRFYATSFDDEMIEFIVFSDNTIDCPTLGINSFNRIILKPRFVLVGEKLYYTYTTRKKIGFNDSSDLIKNYDIDEELFDYMKENGMIRYSNDMAYLYGFEDKNGYDSDPRHYGVGSPYKWAKKKGPILVKQRKGQFN